MALVAFSTTTSSNFSCAVRKPSASSAVPTVQIRPQPLILYPKGSDQPYTLIKKLGNGAHGFVWEVLTPEKDVAALKIHTIGLIYFNGSLEEAEMLKKLRKAPHIIQWRDDFDLAAACYKEVDPDLCIAHEKEDEQRHAILTDVLPCQDTHEMFINTRVSEGATKLSCAQVMSIGNQALETLSYLRSKKIIHRDLKPSNIAYDELTNKVTIFDFGSAEKTSRINPFEIVQTQYYRAPECWGNDSYDESVDIWSLGAILFELYTGICLFQSPSSEEETIHTTINHLHIITQNMGPLSRGFLDSVPKLKSQFYKTDSSYRFVLAEPPSLEAREFMNYCFSFAKTYPGVPIWEGRIHQATERKGGSLSDSVSLIKLIAPMLAYDNRITPNAALKIFLLPREPQGSLRPSSDVSASLKSKRLVISNPKRKKEVPLEFQELPISSRTRKKMTLTIRNEN